MAPFHIHYQTQTQNYVWTFIYLKKNSPQTNYSNISVILNIQKGMGPNVSAMLCAMQLFGGRHVSGNWLAYPPQRVGVMKSYFKDMVDVLFPSTTST